MKMSLVGFFTGDNDKIDKMESLVDSGSYSEALKINFNVLSLSNGDFNKVMYLSALCEYELGLYDAAQRAIVSILNNPSGAGGYEGKAMTLRKKLQKKSMQLHSLIILFSSLLKKMYPDITKSVELKKALVIRVIMKRYKSMKKMYVLHFIGKIYLNVKANCLFI